MIEGQIRWPGGRHLCIDFHRSRPTIQAYAGARIHMFSVMSLVVAAAFLGSPVPLPSVTFENLQPHEIAGVVMDISSTPIPEAEVSIVKPVGLERNTRTTKEGKFSLRDLPSGPISIRVRRIGYEGRTIDLNIENDLRTSVDVMLKAIPAELEAMLVTGEEKAALREYYEHKSQRSSYAKFFDAIDIKKRGVSQASDLFRSIPGVSMVASGSGGNSVRIRGCQPMIWMDGQRIPRAELDEVVSPNDIAGLEFYTSMAGIPAQYMDRSTRACGSILVWTKSR